MTRKEMNEPLHFLQQLKGGGEVNDRFKFRVWDNEQKRYTSVKPVVLCGEASTREIAMPDNSDNQYVIEQCIGLCDKNGRLIYEGDKIRFEDADIEGVIVFCKGAFCFKWKSNIFLLHHIAENITGQIDNHDMVVVGHIHEVENEQS